jgi:hypothetical protein
VNVHAIVEVFVTFEGFLRSLDRRGGWKRDWWYVGLWLRRLAARLQRVSNATGQHQFNPSELVSPSGDCPLLITFLINQFGVVEDKQNRVVLYPCVTENLIKYIADAGHQLMTSPAPANIADLQNVDNYRSYLHHCYGVDLSENLFLARNFGDLGVPFTPSADAGVRRQNICQSVNTYRRQQGNAMLNGAQWTNIGQDGAGNPLLAQEIPGVQVALGGVPGVLAAVIANFDANALIFTAPIDTTVNFPLPVNLNTIRAHRSQIEVEVEDMEVKARFVCASVSVSPEGGWAPMMTASDVNSSVFSTIFARGVPVSDYVMGIVLNQHVSLMNRDLIPFNWATVESQRSRNSIPPLGYSRSELVAKLIRETLVKRKG